MAVSLETRVPLIDHRVYEFAWSLPHQYKVRGGTGKWLLRRCCTAMSLKRWWTVPSAVSPCRWPRLRGPLRDWAEALLDPARLRRKAGSSPNRFCASGASMCPATATGTAICGAC